jgi:phage terminase large subunit-like protein
MSPAERFEGLPYPTRKARIAGLSNREAIALRYDWEEWWARPAQTLPPGDWVTWLICAGRGFGKTRTGAETVRKWVKCYPYVNLIGATTDDVRSIMIEGESGIMAICPPEERPVYKAQHKALYWPNGAKSLLFSAEEPDRLRGKQHMKMWADELCAWRYSEAWDQASLGLRLGSNPQAIITTTPRATKQFKAIIAEDATVTTYGTTYDNRRNLAKAFYDKIVTRYENTRMGRQELLAEILDEVPGALWNRTQIEKLRLKAVPDGLRLVRMVVAVDPAVSTNENSNETGIVVVGKGSDGHYYVFADRSGVYSPEEWAREAVAQFDIHKADRVIGESNQGGDMVERTLRVIRATLPVTLVHASRGKVTRAEPVAALYEQGKVHHIGCFPQLEDQMCQFTPDFNRTEMGYSPDRIDALVWGVTDLAEPYSSLFSFARKP